jgi:hypothetical protein
MNFHRLLLLIVLLVAACSPPPGRGVGHPGNPGPGNPHHPAGYPAQPVFGPAYGVAGVNDVALFLAGKPVQFGEVLSRLQQTPEYDAHQSEMRGVWQQLAANRVRRMVSWSAEELSPVLGGERVVFYPFGGPDLLHVSAMFPQVSNYALVGLEPVGDVPALESLPPEEVLAALPAFRQATRTQLRVGYFITKDMRSDLERSVLRGVTPVLLSTVALMGGRVDGLSYFSAGGNPGVDLRYTNAAGAGRRAMYVSGDLSNNGFSGAYRNWVAGLGHGATYFKAASYLMYDDRFSQLREFILARSNVVVQDDSGIPFRHFNNPGWSIRYHGHYTSPTSLFTKYMQTDLRDAFATNPSSPLAFGSGYHWEPHEANLIIAVRR